MAKVKHQLLSYLKGEASKDFQVLHEDGSGRLQLIYQAHISTVEGEICLLTALEYIGTSNVVEKKKEGLALWPVGADISTPTILAFFTKET